MRQRDAAGILRGLRPLSSGKQLPVFPALDTYAPTLPVVAL